MLQVGAGKSGVRKLAWVRCIAFPCADGELVAAMASQTMRLKPRAAIRLP